LICTLSAELSQRKLKHRRSILLKTSIEPTRIIELPTRGEIAGAGRLTCADKHPLAGDAKGFGYAGGNNCGKPRVHVGDKAQIAALNAKIANQTAAPYLFREVADSSAW
jgi:hypothetical protein